MKNILLTLTLALFALTTSTASFAQQRDFHQG